MSWANIRKPLVSIAAIAAFSLLGGCGGSDEPAPNDTDKAFVEAMIPHHAMAVQSAQYQYENGDNKKTRDLARDMVNVQMAEIGAMDRIGKKNGAKVDPMYLTPTGSNVSEDFYDLDSATKGALATLGLSSEQAGMAGAKTNVNSATFTKMAISRNRGAIRIARVEVEKGADADLKKIANEVIVAQTRELVKLNQLKR